MIIDFHSHVLPGIDDGAKSAADSLALLAAAREQKITDLVLTPHFYPNRQSAESFLAARAEAARLLTEALASAGRAEEIRFYLGAEVACSEYMSITQDLNPLCIQGTRLLLLEMPFSFRWPAELMRILDKLVKNTITPVIAHVERYPSVRRHPAAALNDLIERGCVIQANCDAFLEPAARKTVLKALDRGLVHLLGTDCHDVQSRPPHMREAREIITREFGPEMIDKLDATAARLLSGKPLRGDRLFF